MVILRAVLLLFLAVLGGYLGWQFGVVYTRLPAIRDLIGQFSQVVLLSKIGFCMIGVILGVFGFTKSSAFFSSLGDSFVKMPPQDRIVVILGPIVGLLVAFLLVPILDLNRVPDPLLRTLLAVGLAFVAMFLGIQGAMGMREELRKLLPPYGGAAADSLVSLKQAKILDTNIIIDGRIAEVCRTGFIEGTVYVPGFVLDELQFIADSGDALKRNRGRRGLDILNGMQKEFPLVVRTFDHVIQKEDNEPVDSRLVRLAKALQGTIVTNDYNLNKVAELEGVSVMNVNELANALKPVVLPGEEMTVHIIKEGKEPGQGIAYLDDGTMVVVEQGKRHQGEMVLVTVGSVLQTVQGKMIFSHLKEQADEQEDLMDRNLRSYYRGSGGRRGRSH